MCRLSDDPHAIHPGVIWRLLDKCPVACLKSDTDVPIRRVSPVFPGFSRSSVIVVSAVDVLEVDSFRDVSRAVDTGEVSVISHLESHFLRKLKIRMTLLTAVQEAQLR